MIDPITTDFLIELNRSVGGEGAGVANYEGIVSCIERPFASFAGQEVFPTIWAKAGALLHGISSTQHFTDGNKRTAYIAALYFLEQNGLSLSELPTSTKVASVLSIATNLFDAAEAADWLYSNRVQAKHRINFAAFGIPVPLRDQKRFAHVLPAQIQILHPSQSVAHVSILTRIYWNLVDLDTEKKVSARLVPIDDCQFLVRKDSTTETIATVERATDDPAFQDGIEGWHDEFILIVDVLKPGRAEVQILIDDEVAWIDYLTISIRHEVPDVLKFKA